MISCCLPQQLGESRLDPRKGREKWIVNNHNQYPLVGSFIRYAVVIGSHISCAAAIPFLLVWHLHCNGEAARLHTCLFTIVGKVKNGRVFVFVAICSQTNGLSQFRVDSICLSMFPHCGSFSIGLCRPLPYAKFSGTSPEIGTCRGNFSINKLL